MSLPADSARTLLTLAVGCAVALGCAVGLAAAPAQAASGTGTQRATSMMPSSSPDAIRLHASDRGAAYRSAEMTSSATEQAGPDIASYQHPNGAAINWAQVAGGKQSFTYVKATEGTYYTNPYYAQDVAGARSAGLLVGAYHFAEPDESAVTQADDFAQAIKPVEPGSLPPVLDLEVNNGLSPTALIAWTKAFLGRVWTDTDATPMIYSGPGFWSSSMGGTTQLANYPLWEANWTTNSAPEQMGGWSSYTLWQFTDNASVPGIQGTVDQDRFPGTAARLAAISSAGVTNWLTAMSTAATGAPLSSAAINADLRALAEQRTDRPRIVAPLVLSAGGERVLVGDDVQAVLARAATAHELNIGVNERQHAWSDDMVRAALTESAEFWTDAASSASGFGQLLYTRIGGVTPTSHQVAVVANELDHGWSRAQLVQDFLATPLAEGNRVQQFYLQLLQRDGSAHEIGLDVNELTHRYPIETVITSLYAGSEYLSKSLPQ